MFDAFEGRGKRLQAQYYEDYPFSKRVSSGEWFKKEYSTSLQRYKDEGGKVYEWTQEAGDGILIPPDWSHAVMNLDDVLGVTLFFASSSFSSQSGIRH